MFKNLKVVQQKAGLDRERSRFSFLIQTNVH